MSDTEEIQLSADTLNILQEFLVERTNKLNSDSIEEDWQLSQFWYSEDTAKKLVDECLNVFKEGCGRIACVSCPSLMPYFLKDSKVLSGQIEVVLFEYDKRFSSKHKDHFIYYDYNFPLEIPEEMCHTFELVIVDPPFLSEECIVKVAQTLRLLSKEPSSKLILCTGTVMAELVSRLLKMHQCKFKPTHARNLGNQFSCFANFETSLL